MIYQLKPDEKITLTHTFNPKLPYDKKPYEWKGTPFRSDGTYQNLHDPFDSNLFSVVKWKLSKNPQAEEKKNDRRRLEVEKPGGFQSSPKNQLIWLGHASYFLSISGVTLLTDPVWLDNWALKRFSKLPFDPESIRDIDYILISHDHRDHCDEATLNLLGRLVPNAKILTVLSMRARIQALMT